MVIVLCIAEEFLVQFRDQFIRSMDADAVVYDLEYEGIISNGDLTKITTTPDTTIQNKILHACLKRKCDEDTLTRVCDMIITVQGNPKMAALGREMKCQLHKSKYSAVFFCICVCACVCVYGLVYVSAVCVYGSHHVCVYMLPLTCYIVCVSVCVRFLLPLLPHTVCACVCVCLGHETPGTITHSLLGAIALTSV